MVASTAIVVCQNDKSAAVNAHWLQFVALVGGPAGPRHQDGFMKSGSEMQNVSKSGDFMYWATACKVSDALLTLAELDVLEHFASPAAPDAVARELGLDARGVCVLAELLADAGLLSRHGDELALPSDGVGILPFLKLEARLRQEHQRHERDQNLEGDGLRPEKDRLVLYLPHDAAEVVPERAAHAADVSVEGGHAGRRERPWGGSHRLTWPPTRLFGTGVRWMEVPPDRRSVKACDVYYRIAPIAVRQPARAGHALALRSS